MLLIVTDGSPSDIDEMDPQYLRMDAKKATEELRTKGIMTYCLTLDPSADHFKGFSDRTIIPSSTMSSVFLKNYQHFLQH